MRETLRLAQQLGLILFQRESPDQPQTLHFLDEGRLQVQSVAHQHIQEATAQPPRQVLEQSQRTSDFSFAVLLKGTPKGMGKAVLTRTTATMR